MKHLFTGILLFILALTISGTVMAQTDPPDDEPISEPSDVILTPSGTAFKNGSADGQCVTSGAACTTSSKAPGVCIDNGLGAGVCSSVIPTIDPLFEVEGCGPTDICHIKYEEPARVAKLGQSKSKNCGQADCTGETWSDIIQSWIGEVKPSAIYHYGTELLTNWGFQIQKSSFDDLTPAQIQELTLHDYNDKRFCMTSRLCVYHPVTGELVGNFITEETICTDDPPGRKELAEGTRRLASYTTNYSTGSDFRLPDSRVKKLLPPKCSESLSEGRVMDLQNIPYIKQNYYGDDAITNITLTIQADMVSIVTRIINEIEKLFYVATEHTPAKEIAGGVNYPSGSLAGISFTVSQDDLKKFAYPNPAAKEQLTKMGGLWNIYRNDAFDVTFKSDKNAIFEPQSWFYGIAGTGEIETPTLQSMNARQENAQLFGNCSILPAGLQGKVFANGECNQNWAGESTTSPIASISPSDPDNPTSSWALVPNGSSVNPISPGFKPPSSITAGNALALVPACVLEGVAQIEGAYEGGAPCKPNECGAYGPFQITTGNCKPSCGASSCPNAAQQLGVTKDDLCDFNTAAYHAARLLVGKSKYFGFPLTNADPKTQKQAIIIAGDSYYGTPKPVARLGGLSYGEWVYAHCDPTYKAHVDHSFPIVN